MHNDQWAAQGRQQQQKRNQGGSGRGRRRGGGPTARQGCGPACSASQTPQLQHRSAPAPHCKVSSCSARPSTPNINSHSDEAEFSLDSPCCKSVKLATRTETDTTYLYGLFSIPSTAHRLYTNIPNDRCCPVGSFTGSTRQMQPKWTTHQHNAQAALLTKAPLAGTKRYGGDAHTCR